ncbi:MAG: shikimate kinase [Spirochaetales bacterium]|jgi:shikimate kinase|nr:shikimate kinase [Spirochaetales bacterium]
MMRIFLMGMKHCGKSSLGRRLADRLSLDFADLDERAEDLFARKTGRNLTVREIYRVEGKEAFQALEAEAMRDLCAERSEDSDSSASARVVALGGGTIENTDALRAMEGRGVKVFLDDDEDTLFERIAASGIPPFLEGPDPKGAFHRLYESRVPLYRTRADVSMDTRGLSQEEALEKLEKTVRSLHGWQ